MNEPRRLSELSADEFARDLILTARGDAPDPAAMRRTLASLGIGIGLPLGAATAQGAVVPAKAGAAVIAKWLVTGVALGVATAGGAHVTERALRQRSTPESALVAAPRARPVTAPVELHTAPGLAELAAPEPVPPPPPRALAPLVGPRGAPPPTRSAMAPKLASEPASAPLAPDTLEREVRAVDAARQALARGAAAEAVARLEAYEREFGVGALLPEARVLQVRALLAAGERARAATLAERIIAENPQSSHAGVVRGLLSHNR